MKKGQAWVEVKKIYQQAWENINLVAPVRLKLFLAQTHNSRLPAEPTT
jgi:hypothetical protein